MGVSWTAACRLLRGLCSARPSGGGEEERRGWQGLEALEPRLFMSADGLLAGFAAHAAQADLTAGVDAELHVRRAATAPDDGIFLVLQNRVAAGEIPGMRTDAISINGDALLAGQDMSFGEFIAADRDEVIASLTRYLAAQPDLDATATVVIDIEGEFGTSRWHRIIDIGGSLWDNFAEAFQMRIEVARSLLPDAHISLYGFTPQAWGDGADAKFLDQVRGIEAGAASGMLDALDSISPALYNRYGPDDARFGTIGDATRLALEQYGALQRTDGSTLELFPLLSLNVFNGHSVHRQQLLLDFDPDLRQTLNLQIDILRENGVHRIGIWQASESMLGGSEPWSLETALGRLDIPRPHASSDATPLQAMLWSLHDGQDGSDTRRPDRADPAAANPSIFDLLNPIDDAV